MKLHSFKRGRQGLRSILCAFAISASITVLMQAPASSMQARAEIASPPDCAMSEPYGGRRNVAVLDRGEEFTTVHYYYADDRASWVHKPLVHGFHAPPIHQYPSSAVQRIYWSPRDDLALWRADHVWFVTARHVSFAVEPYFIFRTNFNVSMVHTSERDAIPEHVEWIARNIGMAVGRYPVEFDLRTLGMWLAPGMEGMGGLSAAAWAEDGTYIHLDRYRSGANGAPGPHVNIEVQRRGTMEWEVFHPRILPPETKLHLARRAVYGGLEAIISHVTPEGREVLERVRGGGAAPLVIAEGPFRNVVASPDRTRLFGTFDVEGRFTRAPGEIFSEGERFWLSYLEAMDGVEKFYFLDEARYLLVKYIEAGEVRISILQHDGASVSEVYSICRGDAA